MTSEFKVSNQRTFPDFEPGEVLEVTTSGEFVVFVKFSYHDRMCVVENFNRTERYKIVTEFLVKTKELE